MNKRNRKIVQISVLGIVANLVLSGFKITVGLLSNSIAIVLDAVNNMSDSLSGIVTIIGAGFASKGPDKKHPMGHGRAEYLSTVIIGILIVYIGLTALFESVRKVLQPEAVNYQPATVIVVVVAIIVKIVLGIFVYKRGKKLSSGSLVGSGIDALYDAVISAATLIAIIVYFAAGWQIEAYLAAAISMFIIYSGVKLIRSAFSIILGERANPAMTKRIKADIAKIDGVNGAFDLVMHDYGNGSTVASVNIETDHNMNAADIDELSRQIQKMIYQKYRILVSSVGVYAVDLSNPKVEKLWRKVSEIREKYAHIIEIHGFRVDFDESEISFDVVVGFTVGDRKQYFQQFCREVQKEIPDYTVNIVLDADISD